MNSVCVFLGSNMGASPDFERAARSLAREIASRGLDLVYGGAGVGLMAVLADEAMAHGGKVIGVMPALLVDKEVAHPGLSRLEVVDDMQERKVRMAELSDAFITMPGGLGTMDEFFEALTWTQIGVHAKPSGILEINGYHKPLLEFLDNAVAQGFVRDVHRDMIVVHTDPGRLLDTLAASKPPKASKWISPKPGANPTSGTSKSSGSSGIRTTSGRYSTPAERELATLTGMSQLLHTCRTEQDVFDVTSEYLPVLFPDATGALFLPDRGLGRLESAFTWGDASIPGFSTDTGCPAVGSNLPHSSEDGPCGLPSCAFALGNTDHHALCIPLSHGDERIGLLAVSAPVPPGLKGRVGLAVVAAENVALTISNLRLKFDLIEMSRRDRLTGFYNRHHLAQYLVEWSAGEDAQPLGVVLFDLDRFKALNDTYGHLAGDKVLQAVGDRMLALLQENEDLFRYGGEEFLLLTQGTDLDSTVARAETFRAVVGDIRVEYKGQSLVHTTLSAGVAVCAPGRDPESALADADEAMYQAKRGGRNQVAVAKS
ncbi:MAG: TIGR00730 family Rossman fold protein [Desulfovibrio sp.]|nr:MAG: TIGR00730 family Rossman fold protein [Desulfovibrio sp.]